MCRKKDWKLTIFVGFYLNVDAWQIGKSGTCELMFLFWLSRWCTLTSARTACRYNEVPKEVAMWFGKCLLAQKGSVVLLWNTKKFKYRVAHLVYQEVIYKNIWRSGIVLIRLYKVCLKFIVTWNKFPEWSTSYYRRSFCLMKKDKQSKKFPFFCW